MRILDRERYWAFIKAYFICFVALVGLYVVIDAFSNVDEFTKVTVGPVQLFKNMGWYYLIRMSLFYDRLCGVISMMAAIFTVTWMQKNNELIAMLAAGIGAKRIIRPVLISTALVGLIAVANQELILPKVSLELSKTPDDDGSLLIKTYSRTDSNEILVDGMLADRKTQTVPNFNVTIPTSLNGSLYWVQAKQARWIEPTDQRFRLRGGWLLRGARLMPEIAEVDDRVLTRLVAMDRFPKYVAEAAPEGTASYFLHGVDRLLVPSKSPAFDQEFQLETEGDGEPSTIIARQADFIATDHPTAPMRGGWLLRGVQTKTDKDLSIGRGLVRLGEITGMPPATGPLADLGDETYFFRTGLSFTSVTRKPGEWYQFASTVELIKALSDPASEPERADISVFLHTRMIRPFSSLCLMFLSLPLVLGGSTRNMFINMGLSLGTSGLFYAVSFFMQYLGTNAVLPSPDLAAWVPLILFGTVAATRWDTIRS